MNPLHTHTVRVPKLKKSGERKVIRGHFLSLSLSLVPFLSQYLKVRWICRSTECFGGRQCSHSHAYGRPQHTKKHTQNSIDAEKVGGWITSTRPWRVAQFSYGPLCSKRKEQISLPNGSDRRRYGPIGANNLPTASIRRQIEKGFQLEMLS